MSDDLSKIGVVADMAIGMMPHHLVVVDEKHAGHQQGIAHRAPDAMTFECCLHAPQQGSWAEELGSRTPAKTECGVKLFGCV